MSVPEPSGFGPALLPQGRTRFRLWAPDSNGVTLRIEGAGPLQMSSRPQGWYELETAAGPGTRYRFEVAPGLAVPDPASRFQPEDVAGPSELVDPRSHVWQHPQWRGRPWHEIVIYELHVGVFGGYAGVQAALPRLAALGITAVELMPLADFPGRRNWGYDGVLPFAPDSAYGRPDQLKALIDAAHGLGLMVYLDVVYNHFGPEGNHLPSYASAFFRSDRITPWGAAIDFRVPQVRRFYLDNALYWLEEFRFDGLRFDAVHAMQDDDFIDHLGAEVRSRIGPGRQVHLMLENEHNQATHLEGVFDAQWNDDAHNALHVLLTGETESYYADYADAPAEKLARCLEQGFAYQGEPSPHQDGRPRGAPSAHLPPARFILFLQNHDQVGNRAHGERLSVLADPADLRAAITLQLLCPQTPLLFMGEEWGSRTPFLFFTDFPDELAAAVRRGRRQEFSRFAAFADAAARELIPDPNAPATFERSRPDVRESRQGAQAETLAFYRQLLELRRRHLAPRLSGARADSATALSPRAVLARWTLGDGATLCIATNFGEAAEAIPGACMPLLFDSAGSSASACGDSVLPAHRTRVFLGAAAP